MGLTKPHLKYIVHGSLIFKFRDVPTDDITALRLKIMPKALTTLSLRQPETRCRR